MGRRPDSQQFVHEPLTHVSNPSEVRLHDVKVGFQPVQQPSRLASGHESGAYFEQFDDRPCPDEGVVTAELTEDARQRAISLRVDLTHNRGPVACRYDTKCRVMTEVV